MTRTFDTWPHTARKIVEEALREFVGDGEGEDYEVLTTFINEVQAEALRDAVEKYAVTIPDALGYKVPAVTTEDLLDRADHLAAEGGDDRG